MIPARHESVHPHIRGVYGSLWSGFSLVSGPSPHTWGLPLIFPLSLWDPRSIPTYVGFTVGLQPLKRCGYGPSPHTWGLRQRSLPQAANSRSIPTYVGFTNCRKPLPASRKVHPHIRGVYFIKHAQKVRLCGPSPHTWGLHATGGDLSAIPRSIPTYVGFTYTWVQSASVLAGPSPHTWGLPFTS